MNLLKSIVWVLGGLSIVTLAADNQPSASQQLRDLLEPIKSLSTSFSQRITDSEGYELQLSNGKFQVSQPHRIRWAVIEPMPQEIITDGLTLWVYDPDLEQVIIQPFNQDLSATPASLFSGDLEDLDNSYRVRQLSEQHFELSPRQSSSLFSLVQLHFSQGHPTAIILKDRLGQTTHISLSETLLNPPIAAGLFRFEVPAGIDVIDHAY